MKNNLIEKARLYKPKAARQRTVSKEELELISLVLKGELTFGQGTFAIKSTGTSTLPNAIDLLILRAARQGLLSVKKN